MNNYVTGQTIKALREGKNMTQSELAAIIGVSDKTVSKWETAKGLPDISLLQPLAQALGVSLSELVNGKQIVNKNTSGNMYRSKFYVCPVCQNVIHATGDAVISCCGIELTAQTAEAPDDEHMVVIEAVENEQFVTIDHPMEKGHYISFIAFVSMDRTQFVKLYPEGNAETRINTRGGGFLYWYCNRHGLMKIKL